MSQETSAKMFHQQHLEDEKWKLVGEYFGQFDEDPGLVDDVFGLVVGEVLAHLAD
jgi:hypothetical protein